eukprot:jgi/Botrbrau1/10828/Bobra.0025s0007.1
MEHVQKTLRHQPKHADLPPEKCLQWYKHGNVAIFRCFQTSLCRGGEQGPGVRVPTHDDLPIFADPPTAVRIIYRLALPNRRVHKARGPRSAQPFLNAATVEQAPAIKVVPTKPIDGQKTGTSGLRKKTSVFTSENYLANWVWWTNSTRWSIKWTRSDEAVGCGGRGLIMSASHNPGGQRRIGALSFNYNSGEPAPERITDNIYAFTRNISELRFADIPDIDLAFIGTHKFGDFEVEVIDSVADYQDTLQEVFDFDLMRSLIKRPNFSMLFDALHAVTGAYAGPILVQALGIPQAAIRCAFNVCEKTHARAHTYTHMRKRTCMHAAHSHKQPHRSGRSCREKAVGNIIEHYSIPAEAVGEKTKTKKNGNIVEHYKFSGRKLLSFQANFSECLAKIALGEKRKKGKAGLGGAGKLSICGEESFGTSGDHIREKDGLWAVLAWLSIIAHYNRDTPVGGAPEGCGRCSRYDYEGVESDAADKMVEHLREVIKNTPPGTKLGDFVLSEADEYTYTDPIDGSVAANQGLRFIFDDLSRIIFRLSGTGSAGATVRLYIEKYSTDPADLDKEAADALGPLIKVALDLSRLQEFTGRDKPTVIT